MKIEKEKLYGIIGVVVAVAFFMWMGRDTKGNFIEEYVTGIMEVNYTEKTALFMETTGATSLEAEEYHQETLDYEISNFISWFEFDEITDAQYNDLLVLYKQVFEMINWEISDVENNGDESYELKMTIKPVNIIKHMDDALALELEGLSDTEITAYVANWNDNIIKLLENNINEIGYFETETILVEVKKDTDGLYYITDSSYEKIDNAVIKFDYSN